MPPTAATTGSAPCEGCDSAPSRTSRLISSPTSRKNTAIRPSLIHSRTGLFNTIGPSEKPKRILSRLSTVAASRLRSAKLILLDSKTPGPLDPGVPLKDCSF
jgi:hypothetical protein